jgi:hypothetical protein
LPIKSKSAGLIAGDVLKNEGFDVTIFEKQNYVGGCWKYKKPDANDPSPSPSTPMYQSLRTNLPKQIMAYNEGTPFEDSLSSFLHHQDVQKYLENFAETKRLLPLIKFGKTVESISYDPLSLPGEVSSFADKTDIESFAENNPSWRVITSTTPMSSSVAFENQQSSPAIIDSNKIKRLETVEYFDAVIVCNGHHSVPFIPAICEQQHFQGEMMHSIDYDSNLRFKDKTVLVVGSRSSGTDVAREIAGVAKAVYASDRSVAIGNSAVHNNINHKPSISTFDSKDHLSNTGENINPKGFVQFTDGSIAKVDIIIWCTGYAYDYPFISSFQKSAAEKRDNLQAIRPTVRVLKGRKLSNLYQQIFSISHPTLSFIGLQYSVVPFPLFYLQAKWISSIYSKKSRLPTDVEQNEWLTNFEKGKLLECHDNEDKAIERYHYLGDAQWNYCRFLANATGSITDREIKYIDTIEQIYNDNTINRPPYPGAPDDYRNGEYLLDKITLSWVKV